VPTVGLGSPDERPLDHPRAEDRLGAHVVRAPASCMSVILDGAEMSLAYAAHRLWPVRRSNRAVNTHTTGHPSNRRSGRYQATEQQAVTFV
jgi:hypothetical protein